MRIVQLIPAPPNSSAVIDDSGRWPFVAIALVEGDGSQTLHWVAAVGNELRLMTAKNPDGLLDKKVEQASEESK